MPENNYTPEQIKVVDKIKGIVRTLITIEGLETKRHQPQLGIQGYLDASAADLALDTYPPYSALEENLRKEIETARGLGLDKDPFIVKIAKLAFQDIDVRKS